MLTCKEVSKLVSESQDRQLGLMERVRLHMHLWACDGCRHFREQINFIRRACRRFLDA